MSVFPRDGERAFSFPIGGSPAVELLHGEARGPEGVRPRPLLHHIDTGRIGLPQPGEEPEPPEALHIQDRKSVV